MVFPCEFCWLLIHKWSDRLNDGVVVLWWTLLRSVLWQGGPSDAAAWWFFCDAVYSLTASSLFCPVCRTTSDLVGQPLPEGSYRLRTLPKICSGGSDYAVRSVAGCGFGVCFWCLFFGVCWCLLLVSAGCGFGVCWTSVGLGEGAVLCIRSVYGPFPPEYCEHHLTNNDMPMRTRMGSWNRKKKEAGELKNQTKSFLSQCSGRLNQCTPSWVQMVRMGLCRSKKAPGNKSNNILL